MRSGFKWLLKSWESKKYWIKMMDALGKLKIAGRDDIESERTRCRLVLRSRMSGKGVQSTSKSRRLNRPSWEPLNCKRGPGFLDRFGERNLSSRRPSFRRPGGCSHSIPLPCYSRSTRSLLARRTCVSL